MPGFRLPVTALAPGAETNPACRLHCLTPRTQSPDPPAVITYSPFLNTHTDQRKEQAPPQQRRPLVEPLAPWPTNRHPVATSVAMPSVIRASGAQLLATHRLPVLDRIALAPTRLTSILTPGPVDNSEPVARQLSPSRDAAIATNRSYKICSCSNAVIPFRFS